jgi:ergothioneine biosynthesis protein EgtB
MMPDAERVHAFRRVREATERLAAPLSAEDQILQSMPDCSPTKWHRAHTTWFFETFLLLPAGFPPVDARYEFIWNSYYEAVGPRHPRSQRGLLSRPALEEVARYREIVDERMERWLATVEDEKILRIVDLGLAHEQQHQELILTDVLHAFSQNPLRPAYGEWPRARAGGDGWVTHEGGLIEVGAKGDGFRFDNEEPRHRVWLEPFEIARGLVTVGQVRAFAADGGYATPSLWLSAGFDAVRALGWRAPLYMRFEGDACVVFGPEGERVAADDEPARHLSFYEADAIARWCGARLPTEFEWEVVAATGALDAVDDVAWQWTSSAYGAYPRYRPASGALGEYNGKFMAEQFVLRGGSDFTPAGHSRPSYRNFWPAATRFQRTGIRLARDPR